MLKSEWFHSVRALRRTAMLSLVVAAASGLLSIYLTTELAKANRTQGEIGSAQVLSMALYAHGLQMSQATRNILLDPSNHTAYANHAAAVKDFETTLQDLQQRTEKLFPGSGGKPMLVSIETDFRRHVAVQRHIQELARASKFQEGKNTLNSEDTPLWRKYKQSILEFGKWLEERDVATSARIQSATGWAQTLSWVSGLLLVAAGLATFAATGQVSRKLRELGALVLAGATQILEAARQVASSSESLARGASEQAASLEETSASGEEINSVAGQNTDNCRSATELAAHSQQRLSETNVILDQAVAAIAEMNRSSDQISKIIKVIDEIAFQTNILALNAAVEAARAGQAGLGFGVVADEVRNLAQRCAQAAKDTASLIEGSIATSRDGKAKVDRVAQSIRDITIESSKVKTLVEEVNQGSLEQAHGLDQMARVLARMEQTTQTTAASAEEGASAAEELNAQSETLREIVERLTAVIGS
ncbi:MAG TPA: methyl-accepting chemotaxis protein [Bryobacteraceae bacterium]|nr:methyl-accepting chemotaxis protein [Bryobacteraceae bacterium]